MIFMTTPWEHYSMLGWPPYNAGYGNIPWSYLYPQLEHYGYVPAGGPRMGLHYPTYPSISTRYRDMHLRPILQVHDREYDNARSVEVSHSRLSCAQVPTILTSRRTHCSSSGLGPPSSGTSARARRQRRGTRPAIDTSPSPRPSSRRPLRTPRYVICGSCATQSPLFRVTSSSTSPAAQARPSASNWCSKGSTTSCMSRWAKMNGRRRTVLCGRSFIWPCASGSRLQSRRSIPRAIF